MLEWNDYMRMLTGLFAIVGPVSTVPLFLDFTDNVQSQRKKIARTSGFAVACILTLSVLAGSRILRTFGISIDGFRVAGGLLLMTIAFEMLNAKTTRVKHTPEEDQEAIDSTSVGGPACPATACRPGRNKHRYPVRATVRSIHAQSRSDTALLDSGRVSLDKFSSGAEDQQTPEPDFHEHNLTCHGTHTCCNVS